MAAEQPGLAAEDRPTLRRAVRLVGRALVRRCPNCGSAGIFSGWLTMRSQCPHCGLAFDRKEPGYIVGAYMLNIAAAELLVVALGLAIVVGTWPNPPWDGLMYGGAVLMIVAPIVFYPFSKTLFLALDLAIRPKDQE